jgi:hypothetical protein
MWGKFRERAQRPKTKLISEPKELYSFLATPDVQVSNMMFSNDEVVWMSWQHSDEARVPTPKHANDVIASFVTAGPRTHLYRYLDRLQDEELYCDTDYVVFIQPRNEPGLVETGDCLGAMISETKPDNIFVSSSGQDRRIKFTRRLIPRRESRRLCKVRGITLNYNASQLVNFDKIKEMILNRGPNETITVHAEKKIKRKKVDCGVTIVTEPRIGYIVCFLKRRKLSDNSSVPFGF